MKHLLRVILQKDVRGEEKERKKDISQKTEAKKKEEKGKKRRQKQTNRNTADKDGLNIPVT